MNYARIENGIVMEIIPAVNPTFPNIPITERYSAAIIAELVEIPDGVDVGQRWTYADGVFTAPPEPEPEPESDETAVVE